MTLAAAQTLVWVIDQVINLYIWVIIAAVIASWLIAFGVVNVRNEAVRFILQALNALTEPVFRQVRRIIPPIGGLDLSPLVVLIALSAIQYFIDRAFVNMYYGV
jgi:YggT family protein